MKKITQLLIAGAFLFLSDLGFAQSSGTSVSAQKQTDWVRGYRKPHAGLLLGVADTESYDSAAEYGLFVGSQPTQNLGVGAEVSSATSALDTGADLTRTKFLVKGAYVYKIAFAGLGAGPMIESYGSDTEVAVGIMPYLGFDIPLKKRMHDYMALGLNARYLTTTSGGPDAFTVNGALSYWF